MALSFNNLSPCTARSRRANDKRDHDVVRENHRFLWREEDEEEMTWWVSLSPSVMQDVLMLLSVRSALLQIRQAANTVLAS